MANSLGAEARYFAAITNTPEHMMIQECMDLLERRSSDAMAPLASHLEAGLPIPAWAQRWLAKLLSPENTQKHYLAVKYRAGRPGNSQSKRDDLIVARFAELDNATITDALCRRLPATTGMSIVEPDAAAPGTYQFGWHEQDDFGDWIPVRLRLKVGNALTLLQAQKVTAAEAGVSVSTVKRVLTARKGMPDFLLTEAPQMGNNPIR
jgi:hypothetical protein